MQGLCKFMKNNVVNNYKLNYCFFNIIFFFKKDQENVIGIDQLNLMLDNIDNFYYALTKKGYYLPKLQSRAITFSYL